MTLKELINMQLEYENIENRLKTIPKEKFIKILKQVLGTDKEYCEEVYFNFMAYPIPWLLSRRPLTQAE